MATVEKETGEVILKLLAKASLPVFAKHLRLAVGAAARVFSVDDPIEKFDPSWASYETLMFR